MPPLCDIPSGRCFLTGPWTVTRSSLRMLRRVAAFCRPLRPVFLLASFSYWRGPGAGVLGLCWLLWGSFLGLHCPLPSAFWSSTTCLAVFPWACGPSGCRCFTGPWTVTRSSLHMLRCPVPQGSLPRSGESPRDVLEKRGGGKGGLKPKSLCTKNSPNQYFLLQISFCPTMKSGSRGG